ncbi:hypothetical protein [Paludisphaera borealis]|uniref:Uncharacterized protein n=1 Tax=Paludisphaera borealis TaxID=1387353 RepID=A0A1U7CX05_9BACT|nr:hypothetical protein [Paludisphaera borealis]APW63465.1 hypothetical protein BSF38_05034 [Paludisphaera borealis]
MDQLKEFLRQVVKYRFWISVVTATLFAGGAYVLGSGPIQKKTTDETTKITSAAKEVQQYASPTVPTPAYKPIVEEKTVVLTKDVDTAWKELYDRQAPLLTWPEPVAERFKKWGRQWPTEAADGAVQIAIIDYTEAYQKYVDEVFKTFHPFDYDTGEGIVASPPSAVLLRSSVFDLNKQAPKLGEVWASQERLWAQRTVLEVVANVNRNATDWDSARLKEIKVLEVGNASAQDQRSIAKGDELTAPEAIKAPNEPEEEEVPAGGMGGGSMMAMASMMGGGMGGRGAGASQGPEDVMFLTPEGGATQYKILPIMMTVLIDQDHVQDLLVELENSPMAIEVMDFELRRPESRVVKPEKGVAPMGYSGGMMGGMMGSMMGRGGMRSGPMGYGGMSSMMSSMMARGGGMRGGPGGDSMGGMSSMMSSMMGGAGGAAVAEKKGTDQRSVDRAKERQEAEKAIESIKGTSLFDPYFNILELTVYGRARFYNQPPADIEAPASPGDADAPTTATGDEPAKGEAAKAEAPKADSADAEAPKTETPKAESPVMTPKAEAPKAETPKAESPDVAPKAETPKTETPKAAPADAKAAPPDAKAEAPKS